MKTNEVIQLNNKHELTSLTRNQLMISPCILKSVGYSIKRDGLCFFRAVMCATTNNKWYSTCQQKEVIDDFFLKFSGKYNNAVNKTFKILNDIFSDESEDFINCMSVALYRMQEDLLSTYFSESLSLYLKELYPNESVAALKSGLNLLSDMLFNHLKEEFSYIPNGLQDTCIPFC